MHADNIVSGVALTQLVGGNSALALSMTVISNLLGILTVPLSVSKFIVDGFGIWVPTEQMFRSLVITLLVPLILGKIRRVDVLRSCTGVQGFLQRLESRRVPVCEILNTVSGNVQILRSSKILLVCVTCTMLELGRAAQTPWMQVSKSRTLLVMVKPAVFIEAIWVGILLHLTLLAFNTLALQSLSVVFGGMKLIFTKKENARPLIFVSSQKALLIVVGVVEQLGGVLGVSGLLVLPCVAAHINQVIIDSLLVNFWLRKDRLSNNSKEA
ncbi:hypothetical protein HHK36_016831 [Tetracentron sinense]|uniref:Sodium/metabolite cotransporter BASS4, chloroplastic n=1 Tax=Tetracentron sinense TaxID=13715 RepID=A0A835DCA3_TETSI|nr:hypothetical protein HHK36_016831 [Tetracentron sinense]